MGFHILVLDIPSNGHVLPKVGLVDELVRRGHRVSYVVADRLADRVSRFGAEVIGYRSADPLASLADDDPAAGTRAFFRENLDILQAARQHFGDDRPDVVAYDEAAFQAGRILSRLWDVKPILLSVSVVSNAHYSYFDHIERLVPGHRLQDPIEEITAALAGFGLADQVEDFLWTRRQVGEFTIVFVPPRFQPAYETFDPDQVVFVGPSVEKRDFLGAWDPGRADLPDGTRLPVVLVSLGSVRNNDPGFFRTVVEAFVGQPWHVVASVGDSLPAAEFDQLAGLAPNVEIHRWVSNIGVLEHARAFVTHGGNGSLLEALHTATPVLVVPPAPDFLPYCDTVRELGAGTVVAPAELTGERVLAEVTTLVGDEKLQHRLRDLQEHTREAGGAPRAADAVEAYLGHR